MAEQRYSSTEVDALLADASQATGIPGEHLQVLLVLAFALVSGFAGAAIEFRRALLVNPYDPESVAGAIAQALTMPIEERRARHQALLAAVLDYDVDRWQQSDCCCPHLDGPVACCSFDDLRRAINELGVPH